MAISPLEFFKLVRNVLQIYFKVETKLSFIDLFGLKYFGQNVSLSFFQSFEEVKNG